MTHQWQTQSSNILYESKWLTLVREEATAPNGSTAQYDIVERKNVSIIIPKVGDSFYMVKQFRYPIKSLSLEFPQGFCEEGEDKQQSALRELAEETGLQANTASFLGELWVSSGFLRQKLFVFVAENFIEGDQQLDDTEIGLTLEKLSLKDIAKSVSDGTISNAPTAAALGLYLLPKNN